MNEGIYEMDCECSSRLKDKLRGKFIVLDGPDGAGKTTQVELLTSLLINVGLDVERVRDPGGTAVGDRIRDILLSDGGLFLKCELLLFMASRAQLAAEKIRPALRAGKTVISDRYISASCAYQGCCDRELIEKIIELGDFATDSLFPDLTIILDVPVELGFMRIDKLRSGKLDTMETKGLEFHKKVRDTFLSLPALYPRPVVIVDATKDLQSVHKIIVDTLLSSEF